MLQKTVEMCAIWLKENSGLGVRRKKRLNERFKRGPLRWSLHGTSLLGRSESKVKSRGEAFHWCCYAWQHIHGFIDKYGSPTSARV